MKKIKKCRVLFAVVLGWFLLSVIGYLGKDTVYRRYTMDARKTPYFVLVFEGIHDDVYPWSGEHLSLWEKWEEIAAEKHREEQVETTEEFEQVIATENTEVISEEPEYKEFETVDESYFSDALFIGDSRTVGLHDYGGLDDATFYATVGMNVYDLWKEKFCEVDGKMVTLEEALTTQTFGKIYFQIGINEMGRGTVDGFMEAYADSVERFRKLQPDAIIFVQGIMKVTKEKSDADEIFNNEGIQERNERIALLADNQTVFYIDMNEVVCDEEGYLKESLTFDDIHLYGSKYDSWVEFLKKHGIK